MEKTSVRLAPELIRKLQAEARKLEELKGEPVTVSDLIRACISEKFPEVSARARRENGSVLELRDEVVRLSKRCAEQSRDVEKLVQTLTDLVPQLATKRQVDELTDAVAAVIRVTKERS